MENWPASFVIQKKVLILLGDARWGLDTEGLLEAFYTASEHSNLLLSAGGLLLKGEQLLIERLILISLLVYVHLKALIIIYQAGLHSWQHIGILFYQSIQGLINICTKEGRLVFVSLHQVESLHQCVLIIVLMIF